MTCPSPKLVWVVDIGGYTPSKNAVSSQNSQSCKYFRDLIFPLGHTQKGLFSQFLTYEETISRYDRGEDCFGEISTIFIMGNVFFFETIPFWQSMFFCTKFLAKASQFTRGDAVLFSIWARANKRSLTSVIMNPHNGNNRFLAQNN